MNRKIVFSVTLVMALALSLVLAGCDNGGGGGDEGNKKAAVTITIKNTSTTAITGVGVSDSVEGDLVGEWQKPDTSKAVGANQTGTPFTVNFTISSYGYGGHVYVYYTHVTWNNVYESYSIDGKEDVSSLTLVFDGSTLKKE